jgi:dienelactone hydrolase
MVRPRLCLLALLTIWFLVPPGPLAAQPVPVWPTFPDVDGAVEVPAQEWPLRPGPRTVRVKVHYPGGKRANVNKDTGLMLTLHNWGGVDCVGTANPRELADRLNVIALCVNYLQSGPKDSIEGPEPYDFGYLQSLDALRALYFAYNDLRSTGKPFATQRIYCTGGSGGGNVTLMANKLAPRTFACVIDLCGMNKLTDAIAYNLFGSELNARFSRDSKSPNHLTLDHQELRYLGNPDHLAAVKRLGPTAKIIVVHGVDDTTCPFADAQEMVAWMKRAAIDVEPRFIGKKDLDGKIFTSSGHSLGDRTKIVFQVAGKYLEPNGAEVLLRKGPCDFERREDIRYRTSNGVFVISYAKGYPVGRFEPAAPPIEYPDHTDVSHYRDAKGKQYPIKTSADWEIRRRHIIENTERVMGPLPSPLKRVPLNVKIIEEKRVGALIRQKITYQSDPDDRVPAYLFFPADRPAKKLPAILCLHQTTKVGIDETAGIRGNPDLKYALELAERGYITLAPEYPSFGEHKFDFKAKTAYASGSMKAIWDNIRAVDLLEALPDVDAGRIGVIGHSLGGHNAMFTALFEPRLKVIVSNCGFTTFRKDDMPSWTGPVYMPRITKQYGNDAKKVPFDFQEIVAAFAPRAFLASAAEKDDDFEVSGVRDVMEAARPIYKLHGVEVNLDASYFAGKHAFPSDARKRAYEFVDRHLKK